MASSTGHGLMKMNTMTRDEHNQQLQEMLEELKHLREHLDEVSASVQRVTEAIRGVLDSNEPDMEGFEIAYKATHGD
jgi:uncharacterized coiled-coil DUF342 family protein